VDVVLVGRSAEREVLGGLLAMAAEGYSGAVVLRGEAGSARPRCWTRRSLLRRRMACRRPG